MLILILLFAATALSGCVNKPGYPERDGSRVLARGGYSSEQVQDIVQGRDLSEATQKRLEKSRNENVLFLLARNPHISEARMKRLSSHRKDFVRAGLARNPALTHELVKLIREDPSHTVWVGLAANPSLDAETLLAFKKEKKLDWSWFAMNPACPKVIEKAIRDSKDGKGIYWLNRTQHNLKGWPIEKPISR